MSSRSYRDGARATPATASLSDPGAVSMPDLLAGRLAMITGAQITNVPFPGSGPAIPQVMGGQVAGMSSPLGDMVQHHKTGKVRILATSGPERSPYTPEVASYREQGYGELVVREWFGFFAPAATPTVIVRLLHDGVAKALDSAEAQDRLTLVGCEPFKGTSERLATLVKDDLVRWSRIVKESGAKVD